MRKGLWTLIVVLTLATAVCGLYVAGWLITAGTGGGGLVLIVFVVLVMADIVTVAIWTVHRNRPN